MSLNIRVESAGDCFGSISGPWYRAVVTNTKTGKTYDYEARDKEEAIEGAMAEAKADNDEGDDE